MAGFCLLRECCEVQGAAAKFPHFDFCSAILSCWVLKAAIWNEVTSMCMIQGYYKVLTSASIQPLLQPFVLKKLKSACALAIFYSLYFVRIKSFDSKINFSLLIGARKKISMDFCCIGSNPQPFGLSRFLLLEPWKSGFCLMAQQTQHCWDWH